MQKRKLLNVRRLRRRHHNRNKLKPSSTRPRMSVFRSNQNISCQIIDIDTGKTLVSASTRDKSLAAQVGYGGNCTAATLVGKAVAERAIAAGVKHVCFDRGHNQYHGRIAALATAAREAGLEF
jgi:large subunit ribosomal protein L18